MTKVMPTVLVIDDEKATLTMFRLFLNAFGYDVRVAENGKDGLAIVEKEKPAIVFTDLKMPEMDGFEVLKSIKRMAPRTEVIVITGHGDMDLVVQALNLEATDFINKPINRTALDAALRRATKRLQTPQPESGTIRWNFENRIGTVYIEGTLRRDNHEQLTTCCRELHASGVRGAIFTFAENAAVNGEGISELIHCLSNLKKHRLPTTIVGLSENFKVIFEMVGIARFADIFDHESDALAAMTSDP